MMRLRDTWKRLMGLEIADAKECLVEADLYSVWGCRRNAERETKVIGYFAYRLPIEVVCDEDACLVAGSEDAMLKYLSISNPKISDRYTIKKTRFGEILNGMYLGEAYAFDSESYGRFYPLALEEGLAASAADFSGAPGEIKFMTVRLTW